MTGAGKSGGHRNQQLAGCTIWPWTRVPQCAHPHWKLCIAGMGVAHSRERIPGTRWWPPPHPRPHHRTASLMQGHERSDSRKGGGAQQGQQQRWRWQRQRQCQLPAAAAAAAAAAITSQQLRMPMLIRSPRPPPTACTCVILAGGLQAHIHPPVLGLLLLLLKHTRLALVRQLQGSAHKSAAGVCCSEEATGSWERRQWPIACLHTGGQGQQMQGPYTPPASPITLYQQQPTHLLLRATQAVQQLRWVAAWPHLLAVLLDVVAAGLCAVAGTGV